jgi:hypothetical protein
MRAAGAAALTARRPCPPLPARCPQDSATLIFKAQAEVAFREQTAGHNALLLFVHLSLGLMEQQLGNAFKELRVKQAEVRGAGCS